MLAVFPLHNGKMAEMQSTHIGWCFGPPDEFVLCLGLSSHQISDLDQLLHQKPHPSLKFC
jgi:hypothetical protein